MAQQGNLPPERYIYYRC